MLRANGIRLAVMGQASRKVTIMTRNKNPLKPLKSLIPPMRLMLALILAAFVSISATQPVRAALDPVLEKAGWDEITFDDQPSNQFTALDGNKPDLEGGVALESEKTVSIAFYKTDADLDKTPFLSWQWRVDTPVLNTDLKQKGGDDRSMAIYVAFPYQPEVASFGEKIKRKAIEALRGKDTPGRVLTYVWGGGAPKRRFVENPYTGEYGQMIFQRTPIDPSGQWLDEKIDLKADFIKAFGYEPASPLYIGIAADSDDTQARVKAAARQFQFSGE